MVFLDENIKEGRREGGWGQSLGGLLHAGGRRKGPQRQEVPRENGAVEAREGCAEGGSVVPAAAEGPQDEA